MLHVSRVYCEEDRAVALSALYRHFIDRIGHHSSRGSVCIIGPIQHKIERDEDSGLFTETISAHVLNEPVLPDGVDLAVREYMELNEAICVNPHKEKDDE